MPGEENTDLRFLWGLRVGLKRRWKAAQLVYCGHEGSLEKLEGKLWQYAEGRMAEDEAERFWQRVQGCRFCLERLLVIQQGLCKAREEKGYSYEQVRRLLRRKARDKVLRLVVAWARESLELLSTSGKVLAPEPAPMVRGREGEKARDMVRVAEEFERCKVEVLVEKAEGEECQVGVRLALPEGRLPKGVRVELGSAGRLLASCAVGEDGRAGFSVPTPGSYQLQIVAGRDAWGQVFLDIH